MNRVAALVAASLLLLPLACGGAGETDAPTTAATRKSSQPRESTEPSLVEATCTAGAGNCRSASGRIIYVEAVDPDGDGDAHFVLLSSESVSGPGISVIDVERGLRPDPLPGIGDRISAAGPVYTGSYGQRQIQAEELHVGRG
ncbi:MAG: hypothetical protein ACJ75R_02895 [Solirubrobacterales bacterium]